MLGHCAALHWDTAPDSVYVCVCARVTVCVAVNVILRISYRPRIESCSLFYLFDLKQFTSERRLLGVCVFACGSWSVFLLVRVCLCTRSHTQTVCLLVVKGELINLSAQCQCRGKM